jgi:hypothetical protein
MMQVDALAALGATLEGIRQQVGDQLWRAAATATCATNQAVQDGEEKEAKLLRKRQQLALLHAQQLTRLNEENAHEKARLEAKLGVVQTKLGLARAERDQVRRMFEQQMGATMGAGM